MHKSNVAALHAIDATPAGWRGSVGLSPLDSVRRSLVDLRTDDYDEFAPFFDAVCQEYHKASADATHVTDWDASAVGDKGVLDVTKLGLSELSMRVRVGRNLTQFNLPGAMDKSERIAFEKAMLKAFDKLKKDPAYGGAVYSLSPDFGDGEKNPNLITPEKYAELVRRPSPFRRHRRDVYSIYAG